MLAKWDSAISEGGSGEVDVWPLLEKMTSEVISRTAFGSSYEEGQKIFELQREQAEHVMEVSRSIYIPGSRYDQVLHQFSTVLALMYVWFYFY